MIKPKINLSVIVPLYNEELNSYLLFEEISEVFKKMNKSCEIIFIDDGSTDRTLEIIKTLSPIKIISFRKNFGQTAALDAGIKEAQGELIVTMDGDRQNDPRDIPKLLNVLQKGNYDVVSGWRKNRKDPFGKKIASRCAASIRKFLINDGIHDSGCTLKVYKKECFDHVDLVGEMHRFIPALLKIKGFKIGECKVNHRPRIAGKTKYNWRRGIKGILDMVSVWFWKKYASRPLHLFGGIGLFLIAISFAAGGWSLYNKLFRAVDLSNTFLTQLFMFGLLIGVQFFVFGLLADILSKSYFSSTRDTVYDIKDIIKNNKSSSGVHVYRQEDSLMMSNTTV
ncbi:glycosyltransferase [Candidatus Wolfebacteria bacterium]|nr:MAG: glycosyltransferase [Candidatus Wolfebacteria bacterium]